MIDEKQGKGILGKNRGVLLLILAFGLLMLALGGTLAPTPQALEPAAFAPSPVVPIPPQTTAEEQRLLMKLEILKLKVEMAQELVSYASTAHMSAQAVYAHDPSAANYAACYHSYNALTVARQQLVVARGELVKF